MRLTSFALSKRAVVAMFLFLAFSASAGERAKASLPVRIGMIEGMSGQFANASEAVQRNLQWSIERVNTRGGSSCLVERADLNALTDAMKVDKRMRRVYIIVSDGGTAA